MFIAVLIVLALLCLFFHTMKSIDSAGNFLSAGITRMGNANRERHENFRRWLDGITLDESHANLDEAERRLNTLATLARHEMNLADLVEFDDVLFRYLTFRDPIVVIPLPIQQYFTPDRVVA